MYNYNDIDAEKYRKMSLAIDESKVVYVKPIKTKDLIKDTLQMLKSIPLSKG